MKLGVQTALAAMSVAFVSSAIPADASTCTATSTECSAALDIISASNIGTGTQGTVTLSELTADSVLVEVSLLANVLLINTGGPHTPFVYNLSSSLTGVTVAIDTAAPNQSSTSPKPFDVLSGSQTETPYGTFTNGIGYEGQNGGGHGNPGPLYFTVTDTNGINLTDFVVNGGSYFFGADVIGTGGQTGGIAANTLSCVADCGTGSPPPATTPLPATFPLFASGLAGFGWFARRRRKQAAA